MLESYLPIYQVALDLGALRNEAGFFKEIPSLSEVSGAEAVKFSDLLKAIHRKCLDYSLNNTAEMAKIASDKTPPASYSEMFSVLDHLHNLLSYELKKEALFRIPPERKEYFEHDNLFGPEVAIAFPSCERDIRKAGSCYALGQEDACVHHLMLVLERGLGALAIAVGVGASYHHSNWQTVIDQIEVKLKSLPRGPQLDFYRAVNAQFGFLKEAYRNHSAHTRDDPYDLAKVSVVRVFGTASGVI